MFSFAVKAKIAIFSRESVSAEVLMNELCLPLLSSIYMAKPH
jgi:hypothetical protein